MLWNARTLCVCVAGFLLVAGAGAGAANTGHLETVGLSHDGDRVELFFSGWYPGDGGSPADVFTLNDPPRIVVDLPGLAQPVVPEDLTQLPPGVIGVRWTVYQDDPIVPVVRYVVEMDRPVELEVTPKENGLTVCATPFSETDKKTIFEKPANDYAPEIEGDLSTDSYAAPDSKSPFVKKNAAVAFVSPFSYASQPFEASGGPDDASPPMGSADPGNASWMSDIRVMSLDVEGASVHAVLRSISEFSGVNIVADQDVRGSVIIKVNELPWPKVLDAVCLSQGLRATPGDGVIRVTTLNTVQSEELEIQAAARRKEDLMPLETKVIPVGYAKASELMESLTFLLSTRGRLQVDERTNSLLVTDTDVRIESL